MPLGASEIAVLYWLVADFAVRVGNGGRLDELSMSFLSLFVSTYSDIR